jgi:hypothetical protein
MRGPAVHHVSGVLRRRHIAVRWLVVLAAACGASLLQASNALAVGNDAFPGSLLSTSGNYYVQTTESTAGATFDPSTDPFPSATSNIGATVWYTWDSPSWPVQVTATTAAYTNVYGSQLQTASNYDTVLGVYRHLSDLSLSEVASNDDSVGLQSTVTFTSLPSTVYRFEVAGFGGATGNLNFLIATRPTNDDFANATTLTGSGSTFDGSLSGSTVQAGEPGTFDNTSVWYAYTPSADGYLDGSLTNTGSVVQMGVQQGSSVTSLTMVTPSYGTSFRVKLTGGTQYYIEVFGFAHDFTLQWSFTPIPANDNFANATAIAGTSGTTSGTSAGASVEPGEPELNSFTPSSVWYAYTATQDGWLNLTLANTGGLLGFDVQQGADVAHLTEVAPVNGNSLRLHVTSGQVYDIQVRGGSHTFDLSWSEDAAPGNDNFANATAILGGSISDGTFFGTTFAASAEPGEPNTPGDTVSVWYSWTPTGRGDASLISGGSPAPNIAVYTGSTLASLTTVADASTSPTFRTVANQTYWIQISATTANSGHFSFVHVFNPSPANDDFANASAITGASGSLNGSTAGAGTENEEPNGGSQASVWYAWTAPGSGWVDLGLTGTGGAVAMSVQQGSSVDHLTLVAASDPAAEHFHATVGHVYDIQVFGTQHAFSLSWSETASPSNDDYANAQVIPITTGSPGTIIGTSSQASGEPGEPNVSSTLVSVWYSWTPTVSGDAQISVNGSNALQVFTGSDVASLTSVAGPGGSVSFRAIKNTTYLIQVLSPTSSEGPFGMAMAFNPAPANDDFADASPLSVGLGTTVSTTGTFAHASNQAGEPNSSQTQTVWFTWTPTYTGVAEIVSHTSNVNVAIYIGNNVGNLYEVAPAAGDVQWPAVANQTYMIQVGTATAGSYSLVSFQNESDISSTMSGPAAGTIGSQLTYSAVVHNAGPFSTTVQYTVTPSVPVRLNSVTTAASCDAQGGGALSCSKLLSPGSSFSLKYRVGVPTAGALTVTGAPVSFDGYVDPAPGNNTASKSTAVNAAAGTRYTSVTDDGFTDATITLGAAGNTVFWNNLGPSSNVVQDLSGLGLFSIALQAPVDFASYQFWAAGTYVITSPPDDTTQTVVVPLKHSPVSGGVSTTFVLTWAAFQAPTGYQYELDIKRPGSTLWQDWLTTGLKSGQFTPDRGTGTYTFRARLLKPGTLTASGWAATKMVVS